MNVLNLSLPAAACLIGLLASEAAAQAPGPPGPGQGPGPGRFGMRSSPLMQALDADGDGELSEKEIASATAALKSLDRDGNGKLSADELRPAPGGAGGRGPGAMDLPNPQEVVAQLLSFDKNGDGKLARDELPERLQVLIDRADANKDGFLDKAELTAHAVQAARRGPRDGGNTPQRRDRRGNPSARSDT